MERAVADFEFEVFLRSSGEVGFEGSVIVAIMDSETSGTLGSTLEGGIEEAAEVAKPWARIAEMLWKYHGCNWLG